jgi:hypothetical protein
MDETRVRALIREEIALAFRALSVAANDLDMPYETSELDSRALTNIEQAADRAAHEFKELCETADEQRVEDAKNPFEEKTTDADEITQRLRGIRDSLVASGGHPSHIGDLDRLIKKRTHDPLACDHYYPWISEGKAATHCEHCGTARPF